MFRFVIAMCMGVTTMGCAADGGDDEDTLLREQLFAAEYELVDAADDVDALVADDELISAEAVPGIDAVEYEIAAVDGDDLVTRRIDARTRRIVDELRERADDRTRADADRARHVRARLADRLRDGRGRRPDHRAARARIDREDLATEWVDRDGRRSRVRERLDGG
ncbi:MAG TPA: hypothetical protein VFG69_00295 [Nannocystaceae bacterium]|nr:hypothetical protein [Nannocystaceae bacterium]